jgi:hypothetical protein
MEKMLKKGHSGVIAQLHAIQAVETPYVLQDLQSILSKHQVIFSTPQGLPPSRGFHDHSITPVPGSLPPNIHPHCHPFSQKNKVEKMVQELLNTGVICPGTIPYSSPVVMFLKKEGSWRMCPDFHTLNKLTIKDKFLIPDIDDLLDELSGHKSFIMVVVDRLSKYDHLCSVQHPFTTSTVAQLFMDQVFKLHGIPHSIVSDRDPTFTSNFWQELLKLQGTQLHLNTTYHPQIDGQTEVVNKCLETYLRCFAS